MAEEAEHQRISTGLGWLFWIPPAILLMYVLSFGPVIGLARKGVISKPATATIYAPLLFCGDKCPPLGNALLWYVHLFS